jgi:NAD(P)-dependent dehydrogenase (short-subunit alcohol dehydrogenase family)
MAMELYNPFSLLGKVIVITGASSGIGRQCALRCSEMGARLILMGRNVERLTETKDALANKDIHQLCAVDLGNFSEVEKCLENARDIVGKIHGVIHCAGISTTLPFRMITPENMNEFFTTNVMSAMHLTKIATKAVNFNKDGGSIVFLTSVMSVVGENGKSLYSMSKGALLAGSRSLSVEFSKRKIRVNCISPGVVVTPMSQNAIYSQDAESLARVTNLHPLGLGTVDDVANACIYLLSDASRWVTGTNLMVDGGYTAK